MRSLRELAEFYSGGTPPKAVSSYWNGSIPWISARDMKSLHNTESVHALTSEGAAQVTLTPKGSVLVLVRGMGLFKDLPVVLCDRPVTFNQDIKSLVPKRGVDSAFLAFALVAHKNQILRHVDYAGHGTGRLATSALASVQLPVPTFAEQMKIAEIFRTWDRAVTKLREKRNKMARQKRGLMQISPTTRARTVRLGEIGTLIRGRGGITKADLVDEGVSCLRYGEIYTTYGCTTATLASSVSADAASRATPLQYGDIIFATSGETFSEIGRAVGWIGRSPAVVGGDTVVLRDHGQNPLFLAHALNSTAVAMQKARLSKGQSVVHLQLSELTKLLVSLPPLSEQRRMADVFFTWDRAIENLDRLEVATRRQERGLMRALL